jgi:hypothetical protein
VLEASFCARPRFAELATTVFAAQIPFDELEEIDMQEIREILDG